MHKNAWRRRNFWKNWNLAGLDLKNWRERQYTKVKTQSAQTSPKLKFRYEIMPLSIQYLHLKSPLLVKNMTLFSKHLALVKCQKSLWWIKQIHRPGGALYRPIQGHKWQWHHEWRRVSSKSHEWCHWHEWPCIGWYIPHPGRCISNPLENITNRDVLHTNHDVLQNTSRMVHYMNVCVL